MVESSRNDVVDVERLSLPRPRGGGGLMLDDAGGVRPSTRVSMRNEADVKEKPGSGSSAAVAPRQSADPSSASADSHEDALDSDLEESDQDPAGAGAGADRPAGVLDRVLSRITTRSSIDPGPPPDGGWVGWSQCTRILFCPLLSCSMFGVTVTASYKAHRLIVTFHRSCRTSSYHEYLVRVPHSFPLNHIRGVLSRYS